MNSISTISLSSRGSDNLINHEYRPHQTDDEVEFLGIVTPMGHQEQSLQDVADQQPRRKRTRASGQGKLINFNFCENCRIWRRARLEYNWGRQICSPCHENFYGHQKEPQRTSGDDDQLNKPICGICEDETRDILMMPCAHYIGSACVWQIEDCPFCWAPIEWAFESVSN